MATPLGDDRELAQELLGRMAPHPLFSTNVPWVVAVSGGSDSLALALLLLRAPSAPRIVLAHHDHRVHEGSSRARHLVEDFAGEVELHVSTSRQRGPRSEASLRQERYDALAALARELGGVLVTGHTMDDQAETLLLQLLRGAGLGGARGVAPVTTWPTRDAAAVPIHRPLLSCRRAELQAYLRATARPWIDDPTNHDGTNLRARLRHEVMPLLSRVSGRDPTAALARFTEHARDAYAALDARLPATSETAVLAALETPLLDHWLRACGVPNRDQVVTAREAIRCGEDTGFDLGGGLRFVIQGGRVAVEPADARGEDPPHSPTLTVAHRSALPIDVPAGSCFLSATRTPLPLTLRPWRAGDRFHPRGMTGTKLVSDLLRELRIPSHDREHVQVAVTRDDEIAWIVPHRIDGRFAARPDETDILELSVD